MNIDLYPIYGAVQSVNITKEQSAVIIDLLKVVHTGHFVSLLCHFTSLIMIVV